MSMYGGAGDRDRHPDEDGVLDPDEMPFYREPKASADAPSARPLTTAEWQEIWYPMEGADD